MSKRMIAPLIFGLGGIVILLWLGFWQLGRLEWKQGIIERVTTQMGADPVSLVSQYKRTDSILDRNYVRVAFDGVLTGREAHVYAPQAGQNLGYHVVAEFQSSGKSMLLDLGIIPASAKEDARPSGPIRGTGHVLTPQDHDDAFTPDPDLEKNIYFSRFLAPIAQNMNTTPFMVVVEQAEIQIDGTWRPYDATAFRPVQASFKNDHLEYAITWFSLALVWLGMTLYLLWRIRRKTV
ncbi:SURF1-like protein [Amylibacter marinus]|uniref:SURF1-like protein n=1 Tax=Amylibacter marinus TaxID=1475483 RepID=A0ABQ5VUI0_9RHOB|nr:SURF1 family protein [Amylibacter marinus]GLQ34916.1 SURF1-like protein [Amylibacter marinus]